MVYPNVRGSAAHGVSIMRPGLLDDRVTLAFILSQGADVSDTCDQAL